MLHGTLKAMPTQAAEYRYASWQPSHTGSYLWPVVLRHLARQIASGQHVFEVGCGNGAFSAELRRRGYQVVGIDPSTSGIAQGKARWPDLEIHVGSGYDDLATQFGTFPAVISLEVIEHVYAPRDFMQTVFNLVQPGGLTILSTPFHGYLKNIVLAAANKMDHHYGPLWDHGHIKFWSIRTLSTLLQEIGFSDIKYAFAGRFYPISKSMVAIARRPR